MSMQCHSQNNIKIYGKQTKIQSNLDNIPILDYFCEHRQISDNILSYLILFTLKRNQGKGGLLAINIDMSKAFDRGTWECLTTTPQALSNHFYLLIKICISTISSSNGIPTTHLFSSCVCKSSLCSLKLRLIKTNINR